MDASAEARDVRCNKQTHSRGDSRRMRIRARARGFTKCGRAARCSTSISRRNDDTSCASRAWATRTQRERRGETGRSEEGECGRELTRRRILARRIPTSGVSLCRTPRHSGWSPRVRYTYVHMRECLSRSPEMLFFSINRNSRLTRRAFKYPLLIARG